MGENDRIALYMPGITLIPQQGTLPTEADQQIEQLRAAMSRSMRKSLLYPELKRPLHRFSSERSRHPTVMRGSAGRA